MIASRRGGGGGASAGGDRVRTHLFFSSQAEHHTMKRKRRTHNKLHQMLHNKKDEMVQTGTGASSRELDPHQWTGNQRVLHFGPMAARDPFFYYYPKGWDVLYPAHFGFFPYRTEKFRGSSPVICLAAFGVFMLLGGALMTFLGYFLLHETPFWLLPPHSSPPPVQIAGPVLFTVGAVLLFLGAICTFSRLQLLDSKLHHTRPHEEIARVKILTHECEDPAIVYTQSPYQPLPPPAYPVLSNRYAHSSCLTNPQSELKLYPPVMPGYSTLSLHGRSPSDVYTGSVYNTLRSLSTSRYHQSLGDQNSVILENARSTSAIVSARRRSNQMPAAMAVSSRRAKSMGPPAVRATNRRQSREM